MQTNDTIFDTLNLSEAKILIVEDDQLSGMMMEIMFKNYGAGCTLALSGSDALVAIHAEMFDLIILDFQMPVLSGFDVLRVLRAHPDPRVRNTFVVALTAHVRERQRILDAGCDLYFSKPIIDPGTFLSAIDSAIKQKRVHS